MAFSIRSAVLLRPGSQLGITAAVQAILDAYSTEVLGSLFIYDANGVLQPGSSPPDALPARSEILRKDHINLYLAELLAPATINALFTAGPWYFQYGRVLAYQDVLGITGAPPYADPLHKPAFGLTHVVHGENIGSFSRTPGDGPNTLFGNRILGGPPAAGDPAGKYIFEFSESWTFEFQDGGGIITPISSYLGPDKQAEFDATPGIPARYLIVFGIEMYFFDFDLAAVAPGGACPDDFEFRSVFYYGLRELP